MDHYRAPRAPRQYAAEILALPHRADRQAALEAVPEHLREWVRHLVADAFARRAAREAAARRKGEMMEDATDE